MMSTEMVLTTQVTITDRGGSLRERLRSRLFDVAALQCAAHGQSPLSLTIDDRENGWFDARWITCCDALRQQAGRIITGRC
jgi:hypothetical protein